MQTVTNDNFGPLIAYLVPGFTALWGASFFSETIHAWLAGTTVDGPSIGGFLYVTLAALAAGLTGYKQAIRCKTNSEYTARLAHCGTQHAAFATIPQLYGSSTYGQITAAGGPADAVAGAACTAEL